MHVGRRYSLREVLLWTLRELLVFFTVALLPTIGWLVLDWHWLAMPWQPVALVGTAVAFVTGFKSNAAYGRLWEARSVWGSIVNTSRTWAVQVLDFPSKDAGGRALLIHRHLAWVTALRFSLREARGWETAHDRENSRYQRFYDVTEWSGSLQTELEALLPEAEVRAVLSKKSRTTHLLAAQSAALRTLAEAGHLSDLRFLELERTVAALYDCQGRCERIKNFPYPRQFATVNSYFIWILAVWLPFALMPELQRLGTAYVWLTLPISTLISWVFHMIDKIGISSENPFEGGPNDVPISTLARTIEIDLRELLGEASVPPALVARNNILM